MKPPLLLYSTNTWLAFSIAERYYGGIHYAWCSPVYDGTTAELHVNIPPTSSPAEIYRNLLEEVRRGEQHSAEITRIAGGIATGARLKREAGLISDAVYADIEDILRKVRTPDFRPVLYVMPFERVSEIAREVPVASRAHPLSVEYRIEALPRDCFDMIQLWR
jgi:hypothetical protein